MKALLVHTANWGEKAQLLDGLFPPQGVGSHYTRRDDIARLLGYGFPQVTRVLDCAENQATLLGYGTISANSGLLYKVPLPEELDGVRAFRAFTATLAWFTPHNLHHQGYRKAALDISAATDEKYWIAQDRDLQPTDKAIARGTVFHERRSAERATVFVDDGYMHLRLSCRATAGELDEPIPFALAVTFEVGIDAGIPVYNSVRALIEAQIGAGVAAG